MFCLVLFVCSMLPHVRLCLLFTFILISRFSYVTWYWYCCISMFINSLASRFIHWMPFCIASIHKMSFHPKDYVETTDTTCISVYVTSMLKQQLIVTSQLFIQICMESVIIFVVNNSQVHISALYFTWHSKCLTNCNTNMACNAMVLASVHLYIVTNLLSNCPVFSH